MDLQPLRKLLQIVFDRASAQRTETEAKRTLGVVDQGLAKLKTAAIAVGGALAAAFALHKIVAFGKAAVRAAAESEAAWSRLAGTVDAAGGSFNALEGDLRVLANAFEQATIHDDDDYAVGLQRMIVISGDVDASIANMGLAANVAAQFFNGQLEPAIDLVARVSTGYTRGLKALGMEADSAQEGLETLAQRSMGAATRETTTLEGRVHQLNNAWGNFKEAIGQAMIDAGGGTSVIETLTGTVRGLTSWVETNSDTLRIWTENIVSAAGALAELLGLTSGARRGAAIEIAGIKNQPGATQETWLETRLQNLLKDQARLEAERDAIRQEWIQRMGRLSDEVIARRSGAFRELQEQIEQAGIVAKWLDDRLTAMRTKGAPTLGTGGPRASRNQVGGEEDPAAEKEAKEELTEAEKKLNKAREDGARITEQMRTPIGQYIAKLQELERLLALDAISTETYTRAQQQAREELDRALETPVEAAFKARDEALASNAIMASALGDEYNALEQEEQVLLQTMQALADEGIGPLDENFAALLGRLARVRAALKLNEQEFQIAGAIADAVGSTIGAAFGKEIPQMAAAKAKQNAILAAEQLAFAAAAAAGLFTGATVQKHLAAAKMHATVAGLWGGFAAATGGFSGGGAAAPASAARDIGGRASEKTQQMGAEINVFFEGPGFSALNPKVQRVVIGAMQEIERHAGPNAHVTIDRRLP